MGPVTLAVLAVGTFLMAFALGTVLTPVVRRVAIRYRLMAPVRADRWHANPTPAIGGVAIFLAFTLTGITALLLVDDAAQMLHRIVPGLGEWSRNDAIIVAALAMFILGLVDDLRSLGPVGKLLPQLGVALFLTGSGIRLELTGIYALDLGISLFWFVGITNALNLLDNMDGLAAGVAWVGALVLGGIFLVDGAIEMALLAIALAGSLVGFLVWNHPPAKIFMGDSGALFLGITLGALALSPSPGGGRGIAAVLAVPVFLLLIPILDTTLVTAARMMEGRPVSQGGRDHASHRLVALGIPQERAVYLLWGLAALGGGVAFALQSTDRRVANLVAGFVILAILAFGFRLLHVRIPARLRDGGDAEANFQRTLLRNRARPFLLMGFDVVAVITAYYGAHVIRWSPEEFALELGYFQASFPFLVGAKLLGFALVGLYDPRTRLQDPFTLFRASTVASLGAIALLLLGLGFGFSRGVLAIDFVLCTLLVGLIRVLPLFEDPEEG